MRLSERPEFNTHLAALAIRTFGATDFTNWTNSDPGICAHQ